MIMFLVQFYISGKFISSARYTVYILNFDTITWDSIFILVKRCVTRYDLHLYVLSYTLKFSIFDGVTVDGANSWLVNSLVYRSLHSMFILR